MYRLHTVANLCIAIAFAFTISSSIYAASVAGDGGITVWVSYDNSDSSIRLDIDSTVNSGDPIGGFNCAATDGARAGQGAPNAANACPGGSSPCTGREKITTDLTRFAEYIYAASDGTHYLRRVYVADKGRSWDTADIKWNMNTGGSSRPAGAFWDSPGGLTMGSSERNCISDVAHHEFGHYFYIQPDRYASTTGYYQGRVGTTGTTFPVNVTAGDPSTVMSSNFPHLFVDGTNAQLTVDYDPPGPTNITGEVLTPTLLTDADTSNDGPDRAHHGHSHPFAQDEWSKIPDEHIDLAGAHTEGDFSGPDMSLMPSPDIVFIGDDAADPGTVLLLDRSGSMSVVTDGVPASQFVQEAALYLYHSSEEDDFVGTYLYNDSVEELFAYTEYDPANDLAFASFRDPTGLTNIAEALETGIDELITEHGEGAVNGAQIFLMSDGRQTTGANLWDQVTRANDAGIQIHTLSFGNADSTTMEMIATQTSGVNIEVAERENADELKLTMVRNFTTLRGYEPIYMFKGPLFEIGSKQREETHEGRFVVPQKSRNLLFNSIIEDANAADFPIELVAPDGTLFKSVSGSLENRGRFNGLRLDQPRPGEWRYRILGPERQDGVLPRDKSFEITAYVKNLDLDASVAVVGDDPDQFGHKIVEAQVTNRYPLTGVDARAHVYLAGSSLGWWPLFDDGVSGGDKSADDGLYHGSIDLRGIRALSNEQQRKSLKVRVDVQFRVKPSSEPAANAHYESGVTIKDIIYDYDNSARNDLPFWMWASTNTNLQPSSKPIPPRLQLLDPKTQGQVSPGDKGRLLFRITGARPVLSQLRVSLGQGVIVKAEKIEGDERIMATNVSATYVINDNAKGGSRDLAVQFGGTTLKDEAAFFVVSKEHDTKDD